MLLFPFIGVMAHVYSLAQLQFLGLSNSILGLSVLIPFGYMVVILLYKVFSSIRCVRVTCQRFQDIIPCHCCIEGKPDEEALPYRMINDEENGPLLGEAPSMRAYNSSGAVVQLRTEIGSEIHPSY